jgi:hypothetical protein
MILNSNTSNFQLDPNIEERSINGGNGAFQLSGDTLTNKNNFVTANVAPGTQFNYRAYSIANANDEWELGRGTYVVNSTGSFVTRDLINFSSAQGNLVWFTGRPFIIPQIPLITSLVVGDSLTANATTMQISGANGATLNATSLTFGANVFFTTNGTSLVAGSNSVTSNTTAITVSNGTIATQITAGSIAIGNVTISNSGLSVGSTSIGASTPLFGEPGGRLSLQTGVPVMNSNAAAQTAIYYTPLIHQYIPMWTGSVYQWFAFPELTNTLTDATTNPSAVSTNSVYDLFVWNSNGTIILSRGPAWTNDTTRSLNVTRNQGRLVNAANVTNGPLANNGTYIGTVRTNGASKVDFITGGIANGGVAAIIGIWNAYNQKDVVPLVQDSTSNWTWTGTTFRAANGSANNRISIVRGFDYDTTEAEYNVPFYAQGLTSSFEVYTDGGIAIGLDSTSAKANNSFISGWSSSTTDSGATLYTSPRLGGPSKFAGYMGVGWHYLQALDYNTQGGVNCWGTMTYESSQQLMGFSARMKY